MEVEPQDRVLFVSVWSSTSVFSSLKKDWSRRDHGEDRTPQLGSVNVAVVEFLCTMLAEEGLVKRGSWGESIPTVGFCSCLRFHLSVRVLSIPDKLGIRRIAGKYLHRKSS